MAGKSRVASAGLLNFSEESYFERTSRPVYSLLFLAPFLLVYELGTIFINTDLLSSRQVRVVAFMWVEDLMGLLGFGPKSAWIAAPLAVVLILCGLQVAGRKNWKVDLLSIFPMAFECVFLSVPLLILGLFINSSAVHGGQSCLFGDVFYYCSSVAGGGGFSSNAFAANVITGVGAGIYEELIFRLILISLLMLLFQDFLLYSRGTAIVISVLLSAFLFSAHHHIVFLDGFFGQTSPLNMSEFIFRMMAGVYFAGVFAVRGFGITAGTHAFYDIIATGINFIFFVE